MDFLVVLSYPFALVTIDVCQLGQHKNVLGSNLEQAFLAVLNYNSIQFFLIFDVLGPLFLHDQYSKHFLAKVGENICLMKQNLLLPHPVV